MRNPTAGRVTRSPSGNPAVRPGCRWPPARRPVPDVVVISAIFTGTVIKWDQEGFEALTHNLEIGRILGGGGFWFSGKFSAGLPLLARLYVAHVVIVPGLLLGFLHCMRCLSNATPYPPRRHRKTRRAVRSPVRRTVRSPTICAESVPLPSSCCPSSVH